MRVQCNSIEPAIKAFPCRVLRCASSMRYHDPADGLWKPLQDERWEEWNVWATSPEGARKVAEYHFYRTNPSNIVFL